MGRRARYRLRVVVDPDPAGTDWTSVVVAVGAADDVTATIAAELAEDLLWGFSPPAVEEREVEGCTTVRSGFAEPAVARAAANALAAAGFTEVDVRAVDDDGSDGWRPWARVEEAGPFLLVPAWLDPPSPDPPSTVRAVPTDARLTLILEPGSTFGSGSHPTTRLSLAAAARLLHDRQDPTAPTRVLDVGTGSGVLAVGAALLGATVDAIDVDPCSPAVAAANATANAVADRVTATTAPLAEVARTGEPYDLVLANLLAPVVRDLGAHLVAATRPGGHLVVSGLLADRWRGSVDGLTGCGVQRVDEEDGWVAVVLRRGGDDRVGDAPAAGPVP